MFSYFHIILDACALYERYIHIRCKITNPISLSMFQIDCPWVMGLLLRFWGSAFGCLETERNWGHGKWYLKKT